MRITIRMHFKKCCFLFFIIMMSGDITRAEETTRRIDAEGIRAMIEKAEPLIEEITGMKFRERIKFNLVKRKTIRDVLAEEFLFQYKKMLKGASDDVIARQVENTAHFMSQSLLGKYSPMKKEFLIVPDNLRSQTDILDINDEDFKGVVFLIVAHEMVHALDDQYYDFNEKETSMDNAEAIQAFHALVEGHAVYLTGKIACRLNLSETAGKLSMKSAAGIMDEDNRIGQQLLYVTYVKGADFVEAVINKKGLAGIAQAFETPPVSTRQVMNPEEYFNPSTAEGIDCARLLEKLADRLPIIGMQSQSVALGQMNLSAMLVSQGVSEREANNATEDYLNGAMISAIKQTLNPGMVAVMAVNFVNKEAASRFFNLNERIGQSLKNQSNATLNTSYRVVEDKPLELDGFESAIYRHVEIAEDESTTKQITASGTIDTIYIFLTFININDIGAERIIDILKSIQLYLVPLKLEVKGEKAAPAQKGDKE
jgi:hypothetical protein